MTGGYTMKEKNIRELAKRMGLITVEDMCQYTIAQLVVKIANKVNELVDEVWRFETDVQEMLKTQNENIQYLLGKGLLLEVESVFNGWVQDGTFDTLLNQSALKKINDSIDETNAQLSQLEEKVIRPYEIHVSWFNSFEEACEYASSQYPTRVLLNLGVEDVVISRDIEVKLNVSIVGTRAKLRANDGQFRVIKYKGRRISPLYFITLN